MPNNFGYNFNQPWQPYQPYQTQQFSNNTQQNQQLISVNGIDSARAYPVMPNSRIALFDNNEDVVYIKSTDDQGFSNIRAFRLNEFSPDVQTAQQSNSFVTREEFNQLKQEIMNGKQLVQQPATTIEQSVQQPSDQSNS